MISLMSVRVEGGEQPFDADVARHVVQCAQGEIVGHVAAPDVARTRLGLGQTPRPFRLKFAQLCIRSK